MRRALLAPFGLALGLASACSSFDAEKFEYIDGPPFDSIEEFRPVSQVMEARCGTLDCHGQMSRPMRIFGQQGLRKPVEDPEDGYVTAGMVATTTDELVSNYAAMVALEPEKLLRVRAKKDKPEALTLVEKPRLAEKHKGGKIWSENDPGDKCLITWILSESPADVDTDSCTAELQR